MLSEAFKEVQKDKPNEYDKLECDLKAEEGSTCYA